MIGLLRATRNVHSVHSIDYDELWEAGKRVLVFDLDNTLCRRGMDQIPETSQRLLRLLKSKGFRVGVLTNRRGGDEDPAVAELRRTVPVVHAAGKPRRRGYIELLDRLCGTSEDSVMIGDRRLTDVCGANRMGLYVIRVRQCRRSPHPLSSAPTGQP